VEEGRVERRLAAILAADVVGFSRLMGEDEAVTWARLKTLRAEVFDPTTKKYGGRIFKNTGDGALAEFSSAVEATLSAIEVQRALAARNADIPEDRRIELRIGISLGDVMVDGDDLYGNGVNVAARMETLSKPGGVCVSGNVYEHLLAGADFTFEDLGEQEVKNIEQPVHAYRIGTDPLTSESSSAPDTDVVLRRPSIAVLPFDNLSGDREQEYFADGIAEDIITALSRFHWFLVVARNSSFTYKGRAVDVRTVGRELGVRYVLEGSVRKGGNRLRISAQLVEAETGNHLWAERYDGAFEDVFDLQDRITEGVVGAVEPSVLAAHGLAAWCNGNIATFVPGDPRGFVSVQHARAVLGPDTDDSLALAIAAWALAFFERDYDDALDAIRRALAITPNSPMALSLGACVYAYAGQFDAAIKHAEASLRLSPFDPVRFVAELAAAYGHFFTERYDEAAEAAQRSAQINPQFAPAVALIVASRMRGGHPQAAQAARERLLSLNPGFRVGQFVRIGRFEQDLSEIYAAALREAGLPE
jgi:TolB-like protein